MTKNKKTTVKQVTVTVDKVEHVFQWAREQFEKAEELLQKRKKDIVLETAKRLEDLKMEKSKIAAEITKNLKGYVDDGYILRVLEDYPQYKQQHRVDNAKKSKSSSLKRAKQEEPEPIQEPQIVEQDNAPTGVYQIKLEDYRIEDVHLYDRAFLIELVKYLHNKIIKPEI